MAAAATREQEPSAGPPLAGPPWVAHATPNRLRCGGCGYGVSIVREKPPLCPMCSSRAWLPEPRLRPQPAF